MSDASIAHRSTQARLLELINANWTTQAIAVACQFDLPDRLADRAQTAGELAQAAALDANALGRLLRALSTLDVVRQQSDGQFTLGPCGELLCRDHPHGLRSWALLNGGSMWSRWQGLADRLRGGSSGVAGERSTARFEGLGLNPDEAELFHAAMSELTRRLDGSVSAAIELPEDALIVDVGGGAGELLAGVLARHVTARGLLFDLQHALDRAASVLKRHGVAHRCQLQVGNFFEAVPKGGHLYLLKSILHDWDDINATSLLNSCHDAMHAAGSRMLVIERLLPDEPGSTPDHVAVARSDLNMLVGLAGRERSLLEYQALFTRARLAMRRQWALAAGFQALEVIRTR
jgi:hypothetical protein